MEGYLLVPPDRGTIIGRALWKPRYVVLGLRTIEPGSLSHSTSSSRLSSGRGLIPTAIKPSINIDPSRTDATPYLTVYKHKDESEILSQHSMLLMRSCEIQSFQHRKGGPTLPTLVVSFYPDPATEKSRKRRSSRTGGLGGGSGASGMGETLHFRAHKTADENYNIHDWQIVLQRQMVSLHERGSFESPMSPISPVEPNMHFRNPFTVAGNTNFRPPTAPNSSTPRRPDPLPRAASNNYVSQDAQFNARRIAFGQDQTMISPSPSLKSRRSDLSSQASSQHPPMSTYGQSAGMPGLPADLPSPVPTIGTDGLIEGWTAAQGRSSALSNHTRASNSLSTRNGSSPFGTTPPAPKESILDRAFQMRYIPGSEKFTEGEDGADESASGRISSIARFEALMREAEERKVKESAPISKPSHSTRHAAMKEKIAGWDVAEERSDLEDEEDLEDDDDDDFGQPDDMALSFHQMSTPAQRALEFISGRTSPSTFPRTCPSSPVHSGPVPRAPMAASNLSSVVHQRTHSRSQSGIISRPQSLVLPPTRPMAGVNVESEGGSTLQRQSSTTKRLSFNEFTKRLSSTSSLLLVQTNNSGSSSATRHSRGNSVNGRGSRGSSELSFSGDMDELQHKSGLRQSSGLNMTMRADRVGEKAEHERDWDADKEKELQMKRCGWRGSVGVFGEGGFL